MGVIRVDRYIITELKQKIRELVEIVFSSQNCYEPTIDCLKTPIAQLKSYYENKVSQETAVLADVFANKGSINSKQQDPCELFYNRMDRLIAITCKNIKKKAGLFHSSHDKGSI